MRGTTPDTINALRSLGMDAIRSLESPDGIFASGRDEAYGCVFGRDSLISALELLSAYERGERDSYFLELVEKILRSLSNLQGRFENIESGEEPGKIIHEYRPERHEHLTQLREDPWFIYPEGVMRNYDSVDSTPLFLIAAARYARVGDARFVTTLDHSIRAALAWVLKYDGFLTYRFHPDRRHGGLRVQSWMDSTESLFYEEDDARPPYPIAPVEAQAYAWAALRAWGEDAPAAKLKQKFNGAFVLRGPKSITLAYALDGNGRTLTAPRSSMGHVLWASIPAQKLPAEGEMRTTPAPSAGTFASESILADEYVEPLRRRLLSRDLFVPSAGIRTLSSRSRHYDPMSYHNGSIWPHDTALLAEGLENFGYGEDAARVRGALLRAYAHFKTPIELFSYDKGIREYAPQSGHRACRTQAWSAAGLLAAVASAKADLR